MCSNTRNISFFFPLEESYISFLSSCSRLIWFFSRPNINCHPGTSLHYSRIPLTSVFGILFPDAMDSFLVCSLIIIQYMSSYAFWDGTWVIHVFACIWLSECVFMFMWCLCLVNRLGIKFSMKVIFSQNFEGSIVFWLPDELEVATKRLDSVLTPNLFYMMFWSFPLLAA